MQQLGVVCGEEGEETVVGQCFTNCLELKMKKAVAATPNISRWERIFADVEDPDVEAEMARVRGFDNFC